MIKGPLSVEDWIKVLDMYDNEEVRVSNPKYWEDVNVGIEMKLPCFWELGHPTQGHTKGNMSMRQDIHTRWSM